MCDLCGKYLEYHNPKEPYNYLHIMDLTLRNDTKTELGVELDICQDCRKILLSFINDEREKHGLYRILNS